MRLLKYSQACNIILFILASWVHLCLGGDMKKKSLYETLVSLEQEKDWMMLTDTSERVEPSFKNLFVIYFIGQKENKKIDINLYTPAQWPTKTLGSYTFSPDGSSIAFVIHGYDKPGDPTDFALHTLSIKDSQVTNIIPYKKFSFIGYICYSPDSKKIYFIGALEIPEYALHSIDLQTKEITELVKGAVSMTTQACSPDDKEIVYKTGSDVIAIYNTETKTSRNITEGWHPAWSPDGKKIVFVGKPKDRNFYTIHPDGTGKELLISNTLLDKFKISGIFGESVGSINVVFGGMFWSPDSNYLYYTRNAVLHILDTAESQVSFVMDVKTKKSIRLPKPLGRIESWIGKK